jgi:hypothetical protein
VNPRRAFSRRASRFTGRVDRILGAFDPLRDIQMRGAPTVKSLLNRPEQLLYGRLVRAFPGHIVLSHVAMSRLVTVDFVVCRPDFTPLAVLEIDEVDAGGPARPERSRRKDQSLQAAGVKVIHLASHDLPDEAALRALVASHPLHVSTGELIRRAS